MIIKSTIVEAHKICNYECCLVPSQKSYPYSIYVCLSDSVTVDLPVLMDTDIDTCAHVCDHFYAGSK